MRTTLTLDDELAARLRNAAHERGVPFKTAVNDALRAGLEHRAQPKPFRVKARRMGPARVDLTHATRLAAQLEDEELVRKLALGG